MGDLLIVSELEKLIKNYSPVITMDFQLNDNKESKNLKIEKGSNDTVRKHLSRFYQNNFRKMMIFDTLHFLKHIKDVNNFDWDNLEKKIMNAKLLVIGGGNTLFATTKFMTSVYKIDKIVTFAKEYKIPIFFCCIGIGPFQNEKQINNLNLLLNNVDYITVRDKKSLAYISEENKNKTSLSVDPVLFLDVEDKQDNSSEIIIGVSIMDLRLNKMSQKVYEEYISSTCKMINRLKREYINVRVKIYSTEIKDYVAVYEVYEKLLDKNNIEIVEVESINKLLSLYTSFDLIIGARMHSLIVGFSQQIPIIGLSWQPKVDAFFQMIDQEDFVVDIRNINNDNLFELINYSINNHEKRIKEIYRKKIELKKLYDVNNKVLGELT